MTAVMGWILVAVWITPLGDIQGEAVDYFYDMGDCFTAVEWEYENMYNPDPVGFTCIPDVADLLEP